MGGVAGFAVVGSGQVSDFMQMRGPPEPHGKLQEKGVLHQFQPGMFVIFVSHQWLSSAHPDPQGEQMKVLRETLGGVIDGTLEITEDSASRHDEKRLSPGTRQQIAGGFLFLDWLLGKLAPAVPPFGAYWVLGSLV